MAVLNNNQSNIYLSSIINCFGLGAVLWGVLLITTASTASQSTGTTLGSLGPLDLFEISRLPVAGGGFQGGLRLLMPGVAIYLVCLLVSGMALGFRRSRNDTRFSKAEK